MNPEEKNTGTVAAESEATTEKTDKPKKDPAKLYPARLSKFSSFYLCLVILASAGLLIAIYAAVAHELWWGALIAAVSVICYVRFTESEMRDKLGLTYKTGVATLSITSCRPKYGDVLYIPAKLLWYDVEEICDNAFKPKRNAELVEVYLPKSLKRIGKDVFCSCESLAAIRFEGTEAEWEAIDKETDLSCYEITFEAKYPEVKKSKK